MLLSHIVDFCNQEYLNANLECVCEGCDHPSKCPLECNGCLEQVHFPGNHEAGKKEYDCYNMINYYVCKYSHKYCSEIRYALDELKGIKDLKQLKIMSIGCGACPDLMALEDYMDNIAPGLRISYRGFDKNELWKPAHEEIIKYFSESEIDIKFKYVDVVNYFEEFFVNKANMLILQYIISYLYNTDQIKLIDVFFDNLVEKVISRRSEGEIFTIIINDVNSNNRGRDDFSILVDKLRDNGFKGRLDRKYFNCKIVHPEQRYGTSYESYQNLFSVPQHIRDKYKAAIYCTSAQLIIEVL